jgi:uncharacterized membrane-anchored protein
VTASALRDHPLRVELSNELHARPPQAVRAPARATLVAMLTGEAGTEDERRHLAELCAWAAIPAPPPGAVHFSGDFGTFRLRWERHTECSTWIVLRGGGFPEPLTDPFAETALAAVPPGWVAGLAGERIAAAHLAFLPEGAAEPDRERLTAFFGAESYGGAGIAGGAALAWTDHRVHGDGFGRILVLDRGLRGNQAGRAVSRLLEIETYRILALLALPVARSVMARLAGMERDLVDLTAAITEAHDFADEKAALDRLTRLAAETERLVAETAFRFAAARAYQKIVERRVEELREVRIEGLQPFQEFLDRRLTPAARTAAAAEERLSALAERVARAGSLLLSRVEIAMEGQNAELMASMDRRAHLQLRLQETVEGLSVVAISYYLIGLTGYAAKAAKAAHLPVDPDVAVGIAVPIVVFLVWRAIWRLRRVLKDRG